MQERCVDWINASWIVWMSMLWEVWQKIIQPIVECRLNVDYMYDLCMYIYNYMIWFRECFLAKQQGNKDCRYIWIVMVSKHCTVLCLCVYIYMNNYIYIIMYIHILIYYIYTYTIYIVYTYSYSHILCTYSKYSYAWCPYRSMKIHINTLGSTETNACVAKISNCFSAVQEYLGLRSSCGKDRQSRRVLHQPTGRPSGFKASNCHSRNSLTFSVMNDCFVVCICDFVGFLQLCFQNTFGCHSDCWSSGNV